MSSEGSRSVRARRGVSRWGCMALLGGAVLCGLSSPVFSEEFSRGQALYENHCESCHEAWAHTRHDRKVASMDELRHRVAAWSAHVGLGWSRQEIDDVTDYLNQRFYRFESTP